MRARWLGICVAESLGHSADMGRFRVGHRSPTATVERPGAGVKGSLRRFAPLTLVPVRSMTRHLRGSVAESGRGRSTLSGR